MKMRAVKEKETTVATKVLQGIQSAFCCTVCGLEGPWRTSKHGNIGEQKPVLPKQRAVENSSTEAVDIVTLIHIPRIQNMFDSPRSEVTHMKVDDSLLELPQVEVQIKKKNSNEIWAPETSPKSNWDIFYESQTSILGLPQTESVTQTDDDDDELVLPACLGS